MKKLFTFLTLLTLAITTAWAGEQTITISRNDGQFESSSGVYYASKGGVTMTMSGGMNNVNYLVLRHMNTVTFKSANFAIKKIIFHCLDDFTSSNLDVFYWGPTTMNVMTVNYKPIGSSTTTAVTPGKFTASGYDGTWTSSFTGSWSSTFRTTDGNTTETRTHTNFPNGWPAGNSLIFGSLGKPVRFSSIDIIVEKEDGDIYDLVTDVSQIKNQHNYLIVNWENAKALSVNTKEGRKNEQVRTGSPVEFISGQVGETGNYNQYAKVKTDGEAQIIKFEKHTLPISNSNGTINNSRAWTFNAGGNYLRITSEAATNYNGNNGPDLYAVPSIDDEWSYAAIWLGYESDGYNARIRFRDMSSVSYPRPTSNVYQIGYNRTNNYFRDLDYNSSSAQSYATAQRVRLYTPAEPYNVTTEVQPDASKGSISLRDGVIVSSSAATMGTSQQYETVSFLVTAANGYRISNLVIQALNTNGTVASTIEPSSATHTTGGTLYTFVMPGNDVHIIAIFEQVQYHDIVTEVLPYAKCGDIFLTEGYVVQQNQVKSSDGENVVFNVTPNLIDITDESKGYYELYSVTMKVVNENTGEVLSETTLTADEDGNYHFTMPDHKVIITATFKEKHYIGTTCVPEYGGHFANNDLNMTCNGQHTNFYDGAQYYIGDEMGFWVYTEPGYRINKVTIHEVDNTDNVTTLTPTVTQDYGNHYSFTMPNYNVWITAYFYKTVPDLYLLGTHNGQAWHPYGPKFNYDADTQTYWIDVYYKGEDTAYGQETQDEGDKYGYFAVTTAIAGDKNTSENDINNNCWPTANGSRYGSADSDNYQIAGTYDNASATGTGTLDKNQNVFMVPAGVYRIEVTGSTDANNKFTPEQVNVTRTDVALTFDPAGGNSAENAVEVSWGTDVTMASNIQTKVHEIADAYKAAYPQYVDDNFAEANVSFNYSIAETTDLTDVKQSGTPTLEAPEFPLVNYDINEEVPVTVKVDGNAWIGWIHAPATEYYKVVKTPLKWIEEYGDPGKDYVVSNQLLGVKRVNNSLWCKDLAPYESYEKTEPFSPDYMSQFAGLLTWCNRTEWDQSNWVELDFGTLGQAADFEGKLIEAATIKGTYYNPNHKIVLKQLPTIGADQSYDPNYFSPANFMSKNIDADGAESVLEDNNGNKRRYYFLNPKVQEYGVVTMAVWVGDQAKNPGQNLFVMPDKSEDGAVNGNDFDGALAVDWSLNNWDNAECDPNQSGNMNLKEKAEGPQAYTFHAIIRVNESAGNVQVPARMRSSVDGKDPTEMELDNKYVVYPLDLVVDQTHIVTAVQTVTVGKAVQSVTYCDLAGRMSRRPLQGVNIIVTRYTDGTVTTSKAVF